MGERERGVKQTFVDSEGVIPRDVAAVIFYTVDLD
jgi:hypothetical protein